MTPSTNSALRDDVVPSNRGTQARRGLGRPRPEDMRPQRSKGARKKTLRTIVRDQFARHPATTMACTLRAGRSCLANIRVNRPAEASVVTRPAARVVRPRYATVCTRHILARLPTLRTCSRCPSRVGVTSPGVAVIWVPTLFTFKALPRPKASRYSA